MVKTNMLIYSYVTFWMNKFNLVRHALVYLLHRQETHLEKCAGQVLL